MAVKYWDRDITIQKFISGDINTPQRNVLETISKNDLQYIKISRFAFEQHDTVELIIENFSKEEFVAFDRVALEDDYFNWYIINDRVRLTDLANGIYEHTVTLIDLSYKLVNFPVSNLSFNNLINKKLFFNMFDIFKRVYEVTPFESGVYLAETRPTYSNTDFDSTLDLETATDEEIRLNYGLTLNLYNKLKAYKNPKEMNFSGKNLYEVYSEIFSILGGMPKVIHNDDGEAMLDIRMYYEQDHPIVNMTEYMGYNSSNESKLYATGVEINSDNIVDEISLYTAGQTYGKVHTTDETILSEDNAYIELEIPIYDMVKAECSKIDNSEDESNWIDITKYTKSDQEFSFLLNQSSGATKKATIRNSTQYKLGGTRIEGFGKVTSSDGNTTKWVVWDEMITDAGGNTSAPYDKLTKWKFRYTYKPLIKNNRFNIKKGVVNKNNKNSTVRINEGDRINEFEKLIQSSRNKLDRSEPDNTSKTYDHLSSDEIFELGSYDLDSKLYISTSITEYTTSEINTEYKLSNIKNKISEITGVNTENRFTDLSQNIRRNETVDEYMYWSAQEWNRTSSDINEKIFLTNHGINQIYEDFTEKIISNRRNRRFFVFTPEGVLDESSAQLQFALPAVNISGNSILGYRTPIENPLKIGNRIEEDTTTLGEYASLTTGYTLDDGTLNKLSVGFGAKLDSPYRAGIILPDTVTGIARRMPILDTRIYEAYDVELDAIASTGSVTSTKNDPIEVELGPSGYMSSNAVDLPAKLLKDKFNRDITFGRWTGPPGAYSTNPDDYDYVRFNVNIDPNKSFNIVSIDLVDLILTDETISGGDEHVTMSLLSSQVDYKIYRIDGSIIDQGVVDASPYIKVSNQLLVRYDFNQLISSKFYDASYVDFRVKTRFELERTASIDPTLVWASAEIPSYIFQYTKQEQTEITVDSDFLVNKNFDETITIDWLLHHVQDRGLNNSVVIGDALTERSTILNPQLIDSNIVDSQFIYNYDRLLLCYKPVSNQTYNIYNTSTLSAEEAGTYISYDISTSPNSNNVLEIKKLEAVDINNQPTGVKYFSITQKAVSDKSWMLAGEKTVDGVKVYDMLFAVNRTPEQIYNNEPSTNQLYIYFTHLNPDVIYKY